MSARAIPGSRSPSPVTRAVLQGAAARVTAWLDHPDHPASAQHDPLTVVPPRPAGSVPARLRSAFARAGGPPLAVLAHRAQGALNLPDRARDDLLLGIVRQAEAGLLSALAPAAFGSPFSGPADDRAAMLQAHLDFHDGLPPQARSGCRSTERAHPLVQVLMGIRAPTLAQFARTLATLRARVRDDDHAVLASNLESLASNFLPESDFAPDDRLRALLQLQAAYADITRSLRVAANASDSLASFHHEMQLRLDELQSEPGAVSAAALAGANASHAALTPPEALAVVEAAADVQPARPAGIGD